MAELTISARNTLEGKIKQVTPAAVNAGVVVEVADRIEIISIIT